MNWGNRGRITASQKGTNFLNLRQLNGMCYARCRRGDGAAPTWTNLATFNDRFREFSLRCHDGHLKRNVARRLVLPHKLPAEKSAEQSLRLWTLVGCFRRKRPFMRVAANDCSEPKLTSPLFGTIGRFRGKEGRFPILISVRNCLPVEERSHSICCFLHCLEFVVEVHMAELIKRQIFMLIRQLLDKLG